MAWENLGTVISLPADEDLRLDQYKIVVLDAASLKVRRPNAATDIPFGILQNAPNINEEAMVAPIGCGGISKIALGGTIGTGEIIGMEYNDAVDAGKAIIAVATQFPVGVLLLGGDKDDLGTILLTPLTVKG
jgi:hypothetical protein